MIFLYLYGLWNEKEALKIPVKKIISAVCFILIIAVYIPDYVMIPSQWEKAEYWEIASVDFSVDGEEKVVVSIGPLAPFPCNVIFPADFSEAENDLTIKVIGETPNPDGVTTTVICDADTTDDDNVERIYISGDGGDNYTLVVSDGEEGIFSFIRERDGEYDVVVADEAGSYHRAPVGGF